MQKWAPIDIADALELLSPDFVNEEVMPAAAHRLCPQAQVAPVSRVAGGCHSAEPGALCWRQCHSARSGATRWRCSSGQRTTSFATTCCSWCRYAQSSLCGACVLQREREEGGWEAFSRAAARAQALRYEAADESKLAQFLIKRAVSLPPASHHAICRTTGCGLPERCGRCAPTPQIRNPVLGMHLHWYLFTEWEDQNFGPRASKVHEAFVQALISEPQGCAALRILPDFPAAPPPSGRGPPQMVLRVFVDSGRRVDRYTMWDGIRHQIEMIAQLAHIIRELKARPPPQGPSAILHRTANLLLHPLEHAAGVCMTAIPVVCRQRRCGAALPRRRSGCRRWCPSRGRAGSCRMPRCPTPSTR